MENTAVYTRATLAKMGNDVSRRCFCVNKKQLLLALIKQHNANKRALARGANG